MAPPLDDVVADKLLRFHCRRRNEALLGLSLAEPFWGFYATGKFTHPYFLSIDISAMAAKLNSIRLRAYYYK